MKTKIVSLGFAFAVSFISQAAVPTIVSYADVFPATESRLNSLSSVRKVEDTAVSSATYGSFATQIIFPVGTTSVTFSAASFAVESVINGVYTIHNPTGVNMSASKFNPEGDVSLPSIFARDSSNVLVVPINSNLVGTPIPNAKSFLLTEHKAVLPQLVRVGDYWALYRSLSGTYIMGGVTTTFSVSDQSAKVIVVNETNAPVSGVTMNYPNNPKITSIVKLDDVVTLMTTGLTVDSYNKSWWVETSINLANWSDTTATVSSDGTIVFPSIPADSKRFWRIKGIQP